MPEPTPDRKSVFGRALELPSADRAAYLDAACAGHPALRAEVEALLRAHGGAGSFMDAPPAPGADTVSAPGSGPEPTRSHHAPVRREGAIVVGRYKLLQQIGEGGMGTVWMADQTEPVKRRVAVKLIRVERGESKTILSRFEAERQAIALMNHPNIAKLLDAGTTEDGAPFFVMELVRGVPLTEFCDAHKLSVPDRLGLFRRICSAVHHAHQKGVIHRDLKPTNILVESHDGEPVPKVIDFGLAKATTGLRLTEHTLFTAFGTVAGTPLYMAPEQATFNAIDVDSRADIYALGVILYELLAGSTPIHKDTLRTAALDEMLRVIREQEPPPPSSRIGTSAAAAPGVAAVRQSERAKLSRFVKGELDWIVMKALAKERDRRYESATAFAADVERFLADEPVVAGPPSQWYRLRKFVRRNQGRVAAAALGLGVLLAGVAGTSLGLVAANRAEEFARAEGDRALAERDEKAKALDVAEAARRAEADAKDRFRESVAAERRTAYDVTVTLVQKAIGESDYARAAALLASCPAELRNWEWHFLNRQFDRGAVRLRAPFNDVWEFGVLRFTPDGKEVVNVFPYPAGVLVQVWDGAIGAPLRRHEIEWPDDAPFGTRFELAPDARSLALWAKSPVDVEEELVNPRLVLEPNGRLSRRFRAEPREAEIRAGLGRKPARPPVVSVLDLATGAVRCRLAGHAGWVTAVVFGPGGRFATGGDDRTVRVWERDGKPAAELKGHRARWAIPRAFTPDGARLVSVGNEEYPPARANQVDLNKGERELRVFDLKTGAAVAEGTLSATRYESRSQEVERVKFSPDGRYAIGLDPRRQVLDLTTGKDALPLPERTFVVDFAADGKGVLTLTDGAMASEVELATGRARRTTRLAAAEPANMAFTFSRVGARIAALCNGNKVTVTDWTTGREIGSVPTQATDAHVAAVVLSPDGSRVLVGGRGGVTLWTLSARVPSQVLTPNVSLAMLRAKAVTPDGRRVACTNVTGPNNRAFHLVDLATGTSTGNPTEYPGTLDNHAVLSPDGGTVGGLVRQRLKSRDEPTQGAFVFTPLAWDTRTGSETVGKAVGIPVRGGETGVAQLFSLPDEPQVAFAADGTLLLAHVFPHAAGAAQQWQVREALSERVRATLPAGPGRALRLAPGGRFAALFARDPAAPAVEVWDLLAGRPVWSADAAPGWAEYDGVFSGDGRRLLGLNDADPSRATGVTLSGLASPVATVWEAESGRQVSRFNLPAAATMRFLAFSHDGERVFVHTPNPNSPLAGLWDATTGRELIARLDSAGFQGAAFSRTGLLVTSGRHDGREVNFDTAKRVDVWDGTPGGPAWSAPPTVDQWLAAATDPAGRTPAEAVGLTERAVREYPTAARCWSAHGSALLRAGRNEDAVAALTRCVRLLDGDEGKADHTVEDYLLALACRRAGDTARAKETFDRAEKRVLDPVFATDPARVRFAGPRGEAAAALGVAPPPLPARKEWSLPVRPYVPTPSERMRDLQDITRRFPLRHAETTRSASALASSHPATPGVVYDAACVYGLAAGVAKADPAVAREYADRAMELLNRSINAGLPGYFAQSGLHLPSHMKQDTDLDPLRGRDDFKKLLAELEKKYPPREVAPPPRRVK